VNTNLFRQTLWTDFLNAYFKALHTYLSQGLERDLCSLPKTRFYHDIQDLMIGMFPYCEAQVLHTIAPHFENPETAQIILRKFNIVYKHHREQFLQQLSEFLDTPALPTNKQKLATILYVLKGRMTLIFLSAESALSQLNGDLDGLTYKGIYND
jgi:hypothetical protein